ncbi:MAG: single-stranded-DNA-specific exonuclease RecJ [Firmicutes bacterium]|nr:single-stranded-DNA-specific exonuclease RecJ [Bacillota bacterium]
MPRKVWKIVEPHLDLADELAKELGVSSLLARLLVNRGITDIDQADAFLAPDLTRLHDPFLFRYMGQAVDRLERALRNQERVLIYGDYDVDGITSVALLIRVLGKLLPGKILYYIPKRLEEGYGLHLNSLEKAAARGVQLVITVDCGITALEESAYLRSKGIDLIITDHHEPQDVLPDACAIIDPKVPGEEYPFTQLAGVGVAFKLLQALASRFPELKEPIYKNLDLVAFGTVADIVPLLEENRIIVKYGLEQLQKTGNIGMQALIQTAGLGERIINTGHISYVLAPRINAAGRMGNPSLGVKLFLTNDPIQALDLAKQLEKENQQRQLTENEVFQEALSQIEAEPELLQDNGLVLAGEGWHLGVIGIVASKLVEIYHKPVILVGFEGDEGRGSGRSIDGFNLFTAIEACGRFLVRYGGHEFAAGLTVTREQFRDFKKAFLKEANARLSQDDLLPALKIEGMVDLSGVTLDLARELARLAPYGPANPTPILGCRALKLVEYRNVGENGKHLKLKVSHRDVILEGIGFNLGDLHRELASTSEVDLAFSLEENNWNGSVNVQLNLKDIVTRGDEEAGI